VLYGISGGGMTAAFSTLFSKKLAGTCIASYVNLFHNSIMAMYHCSCNFVPGILSIGEMPEIVALAVPVPLLIVSGIRDSIFPIESARAAFDEVKAVYNRFGMADEVEFFEFEGGHEAHESSFMAWLEYKILQ
jgi:hypothetical protein